MSISNKKQARAKRYYIMSNIWYIWKQSGSKEVFKIYWYNNVLKVLNIGKRKTLLINLKTYKSIDAVCYNSKISFSSY